MNDHDHHPSDINTLVNAVEAGDLEGLKDGLERGIGGPPFQASILDTPVADGHGSTILHLACHGRHPHIVRYLLENGADANAKDTEEETPVLHTAIRRYELNSYEIIKLLLEHGAQPNASAPGVGWTALHMTCCDSPVEYTRLLLQFGADVHVQEDEFGDTPLHFCCHQGYTEEPPLLLAKGADPNATNFHNETPLHMAMRSPHIVDGVVQEPVEVTNILLDAGANPNAPTIRNKTPLHYACVGGLLQSAQAMYRHGASLDIADHEGRMPLDFARIYQRQAVFLFLLETCYGDALMRRQGALSIFTLLEGIEEETLYLPNNEGEAVPPDADGDEDILDNDVDEVAIPDANDDENIPDAPTGDVAIIGVGQLTMDQFFGFLRYLANRNPQSLRARDAMGNCAIHIACSKKKTPLAVLRFLVEQDPRSLRIANSDGLVPLHVYCLVEDPDLNTIQYLVGQYPKSVSRRTNQGHFPVTLASARASLGVIHYLVEKHPLGVFFMTC